MLTTNWNRTKIVATLGPACQSSETLLSLIESGVDVCRLNCSHGSHESLQRFIDQVRALNNTHRYSIPILLDLQGPKIRIGKLSEPFPVNPGDVIELCTTITERIGNRLPMELDTLARDVRPGDLVLVEDGKVELKALTTNGIDTVTLVVTSGQEIGSRKGVNLPYTAISLPSLTEKDLQDLAFGIKNQVEWIALSFVRRVEDVRTLRQLLQEAGSDARIIAKIEKPEALQNIDAIISESDAIMVARGDLGVEIPIEEVPFWQKKIVAKCNALARPVIVATQMLDSMIENKRPTRAEATDVANAVLDGADALMLSGETSTGKHPIETVRTMQRIITQAEQNDSLYHRIQSADPTSPLFIHDSVCVGACILARKLGAKALIGMTRSGYTAFQLARCRPQAPIFIFTDNIPLLNTLNLVWGVRAMYYNSFVGTNETINDVIAILKAGGHVQQGDIVINTATMPLQARKRTNMIKMTIVE